MNIGIFGGTFNPPHRGHVTMARSAVEQLKLDKLLVIPDNIPPHKELPDGSPTNADRYEMAYLATADIGKAAEVSDREMKREGPSYTWQTVEELAEEYPDDTLWLLMGSDMFLSFHTWVKPEKICKYVRIAAFHRVEADESAAFAAQKKRLERDFDAKVEILTNPDLIELSSTDVRQALAEGRGEELLPAAVYGYIQRQHLYGTNADLKHLTVDELRPIALSYLKPKRMPHVLGTEETAAKLADLYGADETEARVAALLHDCTKKQEMEEQLALCAHYGLTLDEIEQHALKLLHARTGAEIARDVFGVNDNVYQAIRWHTTGKADMTLLEKIIYMADYIEPTRSFTDLTELRALTYENLDRGLLLGLEMAIEDLQGMGNPVYHHTVEARDYLKKEITL